MTTAPASPAAGPETGVGAWPASVALLAALAAIVGVRWFGVTQGAPGLALGLGFAVALVAVWLGADGRRGSLRTAGRGSGRGRAVAGLVAGLAFGVALVVVTVAGTTITGTVLPAGLARPASPFLPWALVTIAVASAEEGILRGVLFDRLRGAGGLPIAVAVTTAAFALMHVPLYGWHVVPLDLAVGLGLAGLRLATGSVAAPAAAHAVADLATWWL